MNKRIILGDLNELKKKGAEFILKNDFWPLKGDYYLQNAQELISFYTKYLNKQNTDVKNIGVIFLRYLMYFIFHIQIKYSINYAKKFNYQFVALDENKKIDFELKRIELKKINFLKYSSLFIKSLIKFFYYNFKIHNIKFFLYFFNKKYILLGSLSNLSINYLQEQKKLCRFHYHEFYFNKIYKSTEENNSKEKIEDLFELCKSIYIDLFKKKVENLDTLFIEDENLDEIFDVLKNKLKKIVESYYLIKNSKIKNKKFLIYEATRIHHKIITLALQNPYNDITVLHHGNDYCLVDNRIGHMLNYFNTKKVLVDNKKIAINYTKYFNDKFYMSDVPIFFSTKKNSIVDNNIKKVMLVGFPMNRYREFYERGLFFHNQFILEYKILKFLKKNNYHIIYKTHPDRIKEIGTLFDHLCDEIISQKFENVWYKSDCFVFTYTTTTCLGYALETNRKIILLEQKTNWNDQSKDQTLKDVNILKTTYVNNQIDFNNEKFIDLLKT